MFISPVFNYKHHRVDHRLILPNYVYQYASVQSWLFPYRCNKEHILPFNRRSDQVCRYLLYLQRSVGDKLKRSHPDLSWAWVMRNRNNMVFLSSCLCGDLFRKYVTGWAECVCPNTPPLTQDIPAWPLGLSKISPPLSRSTECNCEMMSLFLKPTLWI